LAGSFDAIPGLEKGSLHDMTSEVFLFGFVILLSRTIIFALPRGVSDTDDGKRWFWGMIFLAKHLHGVLGGMNEKAHFIPGFSFGMEKSVCKITECSEK